jgi:large subunit ribosomal protein L5
MHFLKIFYIKTLKYDLINKFKYKNTIELPKFKKVILNSNSKMTNLKQLSSSLLAFELITYCKGNLIYAKKPNIMLKIRKGNPIGCKLTLQNNDLFDFIGKIIIKVFSKFKNLNDYSFCKKLEKTTLSYKLTDIFSFSELKNHYYYFNNLLGLNLAITLDLKHKKEFIFVLKSFKFSFKNSNQA